MSPEYSIQSYALASTDSQGTLDHALATLRPYLLVCIPLYRRLQFGRFFDATVLLTNVPVGSTPPGDKPWLFAFVDRSCRPETETWIFGSWEIQDSISAEEQQSVDDLVSQLLIIMKGLEVPTSIHQEANAKEEQMNADKDKAGFSRNDYGGHAADQNVMLWGATHENTAPILERFGVLTWKYKAALVPNFTFIWDVDSLPPVKALPPGLKWGELTQEHFALVRSRTQIPRQDRTLAILPNVGIFPEDADQPISWAFVGLDASLTTLHVEPEWRRKGLAKAITTKLFKEKMGMFWEDGMKKLAHGYVIAGNDDSENMCRSLGGKSDWEVYWLRVDLSKVSA